MTYSPMACLSKCRVVLNWASFFQQTMKRQISVVFDIYAFGGQKDQPHILSTCPPSFFSRLFYRCCFSYLFVQRGPKGAARLLG